MPKLIKLHIQANSDDGSREILKPIAVNPLNIVKIEHSGLNTQAVTRISLSDGKEVCVTETFEEVLQRINED